MKNNRQRGFAHIGMVLAVLVAVTVVGFGAYRIGQNSTEETDLRVEDQSTTDTVSQIEIKQSDEPEEVEIPAAEKEVASVPVEKPVSEPKKTVTTETDKKDDGNTYLQMGPASGTQDGAVVNASADIPGTRTGTCNFKLYHDDQDNVYSSQQVTNATQCVGQLDIANLPTYEGWSVHVWFDDADGKTFAYGENTAISLADPNLQ